MSSTSPSVDPCFPAYEAAERVVHTLCALKSLVDALAGPPTTGQAELFRTSYLMLINGVSALADALAPILHELTKTAVEIAEEPLYVLGTSGANAHDHIFRVGNGAVLDVFGALGSEPGTTVQPPLCGDNWERMKHALSYLDREQLHLLEGRARREGLLTADRLRKNAAMAALRRLQEAGGGAEAGQDAMAAIPAPPSSLAELPDWIQAARDLLRGQQDQALGERGRQVRKGFLEHLERLCPGEWHEWHLTLNPQKFETVGELVAMMAWVAQRISGEPQTPIQVKGFDAKPPEPVAKSKAVLLYGPADRPRVNRKVKDALTQPQYDVILALIQAGDAGLTKDQLDRKSKHGDARKIMRRLADKDPDWRAVLIFPPGGKAGGRYRIR